MRIVTSRFRYIDIDAYACMVAYAELLSSKNLPAKAVSTVPFNASVPGSVLEWGAKIGRRYIKNPSHVFSLVDVSDPDHFESFVDLKRIYEVIDHRPGFEQYWLPVLGEMAQIEKIGACATQIYEKWENESHQPEMSQTSARLLLTAILDNTLNFNAEITENRDKKAYHSLKSRANLPENWPEIYFRDCQSKIMSNFVLEVQNDTKVLKLWGRKVVVGQLVLWETSSILNQYLKIRDIMTSGKNKNWFMNIVDLNQGVSYILCEDLGLRELLEDTMEIKFLENMAIADRCWLRKEILARSLVYKSI